MKSPTTPCESEEKDGERMEKDGKEEIKEHKDEKRGI